MSKRKAKLQPVAKAPTARQMFQQYNMQLHPIKVSTPILVIIQRLATDINFRRAVERLF